MKRLALLALLALPAAAAAQEAAPAPADGMLRVFLDCPLCDYDFLRKEIGFVSWVRDREDADVHLLVTQQSTGGGGAEYTIAFLGLRAFAGHDDKLVFASNATSSDDDTRHGIARTMELGLVGYAAHSSAAGSLAIDYSAPEAAAGAQKDPWNFWVYRAAFYGDLRGQQTLHSQSERGTFSANRVTDGWKLHGSVDANYSEDTYRISGLTPSKYVSITRSDSTNEQAVRSLSSHWSAEATAGAGHYTTYNENLAVTVGPGIEYDVFPYSESTRRSLTLRYEPAWNYWRYTERTIYDFDWQAMPSQSLSAQLDMTQPWGTTSFALSAKNYFPDTGKNEVGGFAYFNLRLFKGLSLSLLADGNLIHDQFFLPRGGATEQDILLQRRQLATSYDYYATVGLSYSFGSIFNSVVNPRFGGGSTIITF